MKSLRFTSSAGVALLVAMAIPSRAWGGDPAKVWRTIETPHFIITYPSEEERLAQRLAIVAEAAHDKLIPFFDHEPKHRVQLVMADTSDDANGSATVLPYPTVSL